MADPKSSGEVRFFFRDALPADDVVARWLVVLSMALNDIRLVGRHLTNSDRTEYERAYFLRLLLAHVHELVRFLAESRKRWPAVRTFIGRLPEKAQEDYELAVSYLGNRHLQSRAKVIRDEMFHYYELVPEKSQRGQDELTEALERLADDAGTYALAGFTDSRATYADQVAEQLVVREDSSAETAALHEAALRLVGAAGRFIQEAENAYFRSLPAGRATVAR